MFAPGKYYVELQGDVLRVDTFGWWKGDSSDSPSPSASTPSRYSLLSATLSSVGSSLCCQIEDHAITTVGISSEATPVVVVLPPKQADGARDFILRVEVSSSTAPAFTFQGLDETLAFDSESDDWAVLEPGLNIVSFTETK